MFSQGASFLLCTGGGGLRGKGGHAWQGSMHSGGGYAWPGEAIHGGGHV